MKIAIAGLAHFHVQYALDEADARGGELELVGLADPDPANRATWGSGREELLFEDHRAMLDATRPDIVAVFAVYARRAEIVVDALRAGATVLVDKPLCISLDELAAIEAAVAETGGTVSTIFEKRWYPATLAAQAAIAAGAIGELRQAAFTAPHKLKRPTRPDWFFDERYGSIVSDLLSHDIDLFLHFSGETSGSLASWDNRGVDASAPAWADSCALLFTGSRVGATMEANWTWPDASEFHGQYRMRLAGDQGVLEVDWARNEVVLLTRTEGPRVLELPAGRRPAEQAVDAALSGGDFEVPTAQSLAVARIGLVASQAAREGRALDWSL